jgi:hypothetical protein
MHRSIYDTLLSVFFYPTMSIVEPAPPDTATADAQPLPLPVAFGMVTVVPAAMPAVPWDETAVVMLLTAVVTVSVATVTLVGIAHKE